MIEWDADLYLQNSNKITPLQAAKQRCKQVFSDINGMIKQKKLREKEERDRAADEGFAKQQAHRLAKWEEDDTPAPRGQSPPGFPGSDSDGGFGMIEGSEAGEEASEKGKGGEDDALALFIAQTQGGAAGKPAGGMYSSPTTFTDRDGKVGSLTHIHTFSTTHTLCIYSTTHTLCTHSLHTLYPPLTHAYSPTHERVLTHSLTHSSKTRSLLMTVPKKYLTHWRSSSKVLPMTKAWHIGWRRTRRLTTSRRISS
jgi:hypothetical protein